MIGNIFKRSFSSIPGHVTEFIAKRSTVQCFDRIFNSKVDYKQMSNLLPNITILFVKWKVVRAPENGGTCLIELKVDETVMNVNRVIHGGALASLVDLVTTVALYNTPQRKPGVSVGMNVTFLKPAKLGETLLIEGRVIKAGSKMAYLAAEVYVKDTESLELRQEALVATGTHTKYIQ
jgi:acyl-coenzyme A thioesterase 13